MLITTEQSQVSRPTFTDLLACAKCKGPLVWVEPTLWCEQCLTHYRLLAGSDVPVLLPDEQFEYDTTDAARRRKRDVCERFETIDRTLPRPYNSFATFLNLGYVPTAAPRSATRDPSPATFNRLSANLLLEVLGATDLNHRIVVEVGSGRGGNIDAIQRFYRPKTIIGMDLSTINVAFSRERHVIADGGFVVGDAEHLPFRSAAVEVLLNLESSHYYVDLKAFLHEASRALRAGGVFLYADILRADEWRAALSYLRTLPFEIRRQQDISENVLLSCKAIAAVRERQRQSGLYDTFLVLPGTSEFEALEQRHMRYMILEIHKR
jgi:SAM-dependent methyltransferase